MISLCIYSEKACAGGTLQAEMKGLLPLKKGPYQSRTLLHILLETTVLFVMPKNVFGNLVLFHLYFLLFFGVA